MELASRSSDGGCITGGSCMCMHVWLPDDTYYAAAAVGVPIWANIIMIWSTTPPVSSDMHRRNPRIQLIQRIEKLFSI